VETAGISPATDAITQTPAQADQSALDRFFTAEKKRALHHFEADSQVTHWGRQLVESAEREMRQQAIDELAIIASENATEAMALVLGDKDSQLRKHVATKLGQVGGDYATRLLGQVLFGDSDSGVQLAAIEELGNLNSDLARLFLTAGTKLDEPAVARRAAAALGW
jgi:HEAT repeat protein